MSPHRALPLCCDLDGYFHGADIPHLDPAPMPLGLRHLFPGVRRVQGTLGGELPIPGRGENGSGSFIIEGKGAGLNLDLGKPCAGGNWKVMFQSKEALQVVG